MPKFGFNSISLDARYLLENSNIETQDHETMTDIVVDDPELKVIRFRLRPLPDPWVYYYRIAGCYFTAHQGHLDVVWDSAVSSWLVDRFNAVDLFEKRPLI